MSFRRIKPTWLDDDDIIEFNPAFTDAPILNAPALVRTDTMVIEAVTTDSDTEVIPEVEYKYTDCNYGDVVGMGIPGFHRPQLGTEPFDDDVVEVSREVVQRRMAGAGIGVVRRARAQLGDIDTDSDDENGAPLRRRKAAVKRATKMGDDDDDDDTTTVVRTAPTPVGRGQGNKSSRWCFTYNNPPLDGDEFVSLLESKGDIKMAVFQKETGEEGTEHFQGYMETNKRMYTTGVHSMLAPHKLALLHAKGTKIQNHKYCTKEETRTDGPYYVKSEAGDYGRKNGNQGKRTDLDEFAALVIEEGGITERVIAEQPGHVMAYSKHANNLIGYIAYNKAKADDMAFWKEQYRKHAAGEESLGQQQRKLILRFGPTAVGKTTEVKREVKGGLGKEVYEKMATNKWWDNYKQEEHVLVDEFVGNQSIDEFKAMSNCGVVQMESKGTMGLFSATHIYYTTNRHPSQWWKRNNDEYHNWNSPDFKAVARRFAEVHWWNDAGTKVILTNPGKEQNTPEWRSAVVQWNKFWKWEKENPHDGERYFTL